MTLRTFPIALDGAAREPLFLQVVRAITADIRRGRLKPGDVLPGSRTLAQTLGIHRNTVLAAYRELEAEGWIEAGARTTRVAWDLPTAPQARRPSDLGGLGFDLPEPPDLGHPFRLPGPGLLDLAGGLPDTRLVPVDLLSRALRRALLSRPSVLGYGETMGEPRLREALARLLAQVRGLAYPADRILVTNGSQMALDLVIRALIRPGDRVAVENPGYPPAWRMFQAAGAVCLPVPVDGGGLMIDPLERHLSAGPVRAVYLTPHHQFPTTVPLTAARRLRLQELARRHRIALLEDDYDFEFHFEGRPLLPMASNDPSGAVIYLGTLSKVLAPALRLGFLAGPRPLVEALAAQRSLVDRHGNRVVERAVAELIEDDLLQRHARKVRRIYAGRRAILADLLERHLGSELAFRPAHGGLSYWCATAPGIDAAGWAARALERGVRVQAGQDFDLDGSNLPRLRIGFSALDERELADAVRRLQRAL
ncbi:MAG: PLP-dependent aminotransferase family protein [Holophaga sp.]|nr:PLP-dependent aminotransferase family protein [Holophaga sp.]